MIKRKDCEHIFGGDETDFEDIRDTEEWVCENIGDYWYDEEITTHTEGIRMIGTQYYYEFGFKNDIDATAFKLRWT